MADDPNLDAELFRIAATDPPTEPAVPPPAPEPAPEPPAPEPPAPSPAAEAAIPSWRLREEAEARRAAEVRASELERRLNEISTHLKQQQKQPDFFDNPDQATLELINRTMQPFFESHHRERMYMGRMIAEMKHGQESVEEAERAFLDARDKEILDPMEYERVVQSPNRYDACVQWFKRQSVLSSVGEDPKAWFEKQLDTMLSDPKFQAQMLEKIRGSAAAKPAETRLPPSLSKVTAAAGNSEIAGDMSDASLFAFATKN